MILPALYHQIVTKAFIGFVELHSDHGCKFVNHLALMSCAKVPPKLRGTPGERSASGNIWFFSTHALVLDTALTSSHTASTQDGGGRRPDCFQMHLEPGGLHLLHPAPGGRNLSSSFFFNSQDYLFWIFDFPSFKP